MTRSPRSSRSLGRNFLALLVACSAVGVAQINYDPLSVGSTPTARAASVSEPTMVLPPSPALPTRLDEAANQETHRRGEAAEDPQLLRGIWALKMVSALLEKGCKSFAAVPDYTASMFKQERIGGILGDGQTIDLKIRHEPLSIYMKWLSGDRGRQLIYVDGLNDGNLLVQPGGIKGRLTGVLSLEPSSALAMAESRYPIMKVGILELANTILEYQHADLERGHGFRCELRDDQSFEDRPCYLFVCEYDSPEMNETYRKSVIFVDKEISMPVCVKNFTWVRDANPETIDEESLVEFYAYTDVRIGQNLNAGDFDQHNRDYRLRVRR